MLQISAFDDDDPTSANGQLEYNLISGNVGGRFRLDQTTGELFVSDGATFDFDVQNVYFMQVGTV